MLGFLKSKYHSADAAVAVQKMLEHKKAFGLFEGDPVNLAHHIVQKAWNSKPDIFNGKFGNRPHKLTVVIYSLATAAQDFYAEDPRSANPIIMSFFEALDELKTNGRYYNLSNIDNSIIEDAISIVEPISDKILNSPIAKELDQFININEENNSEKEINSERNEQQSFFDLLKAAEQGHAQAQFNLGRMYHLGTGVPQDDKQAAAWCLKAAEQGNIQAQFNLGLMYRLGTGVPQDNKQAAAWYLKAAEQGDAEAQGNLAVMHKLGEGVPQDDKQAAVWSLKAAEQGDALAQGNLGLMYMLGEGVPQDYKQAIAWYLKAAEQGVAQAQFNLGLMYRFGAGVPQDDKRAVAWFRKAAEQGYAQAQQQII